MGLRSFCADLCAAASPPAIPEAWTEGSKKQFLPFQAFSNQ